MNREGDGFSLDLRGPFVVTPAGHLILMANGEVQTWDIDSEAPWERYRPNRASPGPCHRRDISFWSIQIESSDGQARTSHPRRSVCPPSTTRWSGQW